MTALLPKGASFADKNAITAESNVSLVFAKFGAHWPAPSNAVQQKKRKQHFIDTVMCWSGAFTRRCLPEGGCDEQSYHDALERRRLLVHARDGFTLTAKTDWRFVAGMGIDSPLENGIELHPVYGVPYLPGSGAKGLTRHFAEHWTEPKIGPDDLKRVFGPRLKPGDEGGSAGSVVFFDALPEVSVQLERDVMTPHYQNWHQSGEVPGDWMNPNPIPFFVVPANTSFDFALTPRRPTVSQDCKDCATAKCWLEDALLWLGAGAKTGKGYGRFKDS
jgi:CRISPR-associated protein Cmr6